MSIWIAKKAVDSLQVFYFSFLHIGLQAFLFLVRGGVYESRCPHSALLPLAYICGGVGVFSSSKSCQESEGLREENKVSELGDQTKTS